MQIRQPQYPAIEVRLFSPPLVIFEAAKAFVSVSSKDFGKDNKNLHNFTTRILIEHHWQL